MQENMQVMVNVTIMHTRRTFLWTVGAGLWTLAGGKVWAQTTASVPSPVDVVTQFIAARGAQDLPKAYALLSADTQKTLDYGEFTLGGGVVNFAALAEVTTKSGDWSPFITALSTFFLDTYNTMNYTFTIVGPDPTDPRIVLVNALPPEKGVAHNTKPLLLRVVTRPDPQGIPRIETQPTKEKTDPAYFARVNQQICVIRLTRVARAFIEYAFEYDEHLPNASRWTDALLPFLGAKATSSMLRDPSAPEGQQFGYAFNRALSGKVIDSIANPSKTVLVFNSTLGTKNAADTGQSLPKPGWHTGGSVVGFADGHVQWVKDGTLLRFTP